MGAKKGEHRSPKTEFPAGHNLSSKYKNEYADDIIAFSEEPDTYFLEQYARKINVCAETLRTWSKRYPRFGVAYKIAEDRMFTNLFKAGLEGRLNPQLVKLIAMSRYNMTDKVEQKVDANLGASDGLNVKITVLKPEKVNI